MNIDFILYNISYILPLFFMTIFILYSIFYFNFTDKKMKNNEGYKHHGLSRFILIGIFFMFGLIIFDLNMSFISAFANQILINDSDNELMNNYFFNYFVSFYRTVPIDILINITIACVAIYTGTEGIIASLKTLSLEAGLSVELPAKKRKRLSVMFIIWCYISVISTIYTYLISNENISFYISNIYIGLGTTLLILFIAERAPKTLENSNLHKKNNECNIIKENNVVDIKTVNINNNEKENLVGDKIIEER